MTTVMLKNGAEEAKGLVGSVMAGVFRISREYPMTFYDLVMICRDGISKHSMANTQILRGYGLMEPDGQVHTSIKNIVLSSIEGEELDMVVVSPIKEEQNGR